MWSPSIMYEQHCVLFELLQNSNFIFDEYLVILSYRGFNEGWTPHQRANTTLILAT